MQTMSIHMLFFLPWNKGFVQRATVPHSVTLKPPVFSRTGSVSLTSTSHPQSEKSRSEFDLLRKMRDRILGPKNGSATLKKTVSSRTGSASVTSTPHPRTRRSTRAESKKNDSVTQVCFSIGSSYLFSFSLCNCFSLSLYLYLSVFYSLSLSFTLYLSYLLLFFALAKGSTIAESKWIIM